MIPTWRGVWGRFGLDTSIGSCSILLDDNGHTPKEFLFIAAFMVPCICIVVCYARILYLVRKAAFRHREAPAKNISFQNEIAIPPQPDSEKNLNDNQPMKTTNVAEMHEEMKPFDVYEELEYIDVSDSYDNGPEFDGIDSVQNLNKEDNTNTIHVKNVSKPYLI
ncbi:uncharacterized protein LOC118755384 [Rhagoletis pomonella]|uniref:uncharacterized protein LOC118755384 n=1 Tax=Rhagoletis pomonella TaxID=28610 RepID=UPI001786091C|nr:uncharacterized protein LOC118755384 [Rhagoletis pomonella]